MADHQRFHYRLFGLTLASELPLQAYLAPPRNAPELWLRRADHLPDLEAPPAYSSATLCRDGQPALRCFRSAGHEMFLFPMTGGFTIRDNDIAFRPQPAAEPGGLEIALLGTVLAWWLERQGLLAIHAAAVHLEGGAVAFLSGNRGGKTALAAQFLTAGEALLTDDILPLEVSPERVLARPGYPQMRMWPEMAEHFLGRVDGLPLVHPRLTKRRLPVGPGGLGRFLDASVPLRLLLVPQRRADGAEAIEFHPVPPVEAVVELLRHSFTPNLVRALGLEGPRLARLAAVAETVPMARLSYPAGLERLGVVTAAIRAYTAALGTATG